VIDPLRLARAVWLDAERAGDGWIVTGGAQSHRVAENDHGSLECDCPDAARHPGACKHALCVSLSLGDPDTVKALRAIVPAPVTARTGNRLTQASAVSR
jgi:hypothetical protein